MQDFEAEAEQAEVLRNTTELEDLEALIASWLPDWADKKLTGEWVQYAQLATRDGRRMGNAVILAVDTVVWGDTPVELHLIITDFGNTLRMTEGELATQFYPPIWRMRANRVSHRIKHITNYSEEFIR